MLKRGWLIGLLAIVFVFGQGMPLVSNAAQPKIDQRVLQQLEQKPQVPVFIVLDNQADTRFAHALPTKAEKGRAVVTSLRLQALLDQPELISWLNQRGANARGYLSVNGISATVDEQTLQELAQRSDVASIMSDAPYRQISTITEVAPQALNEPTLVELGVTEINAPQVWALGYTGQGIVVAGEDTGVRWTHNALKAKYRGWNGTTADHNYNWHDGIADPGLNSCGGNRLVVPCDDNDHGTHTVGTMVGDDGAGNQIGVAPGAKWIACRNMDEGNGTISSYVDCIDWMIAPYPLDGNPGQGDPLKAPDVINNSWGCPPSEGCDGSTLDDIQPAIANTVNAGIMFVASAGNEGSDCQTIGNPPALYPESFVVGAYSPVPNGPIAGFSSRGPIVYASGSRIGPDITAPGVATRSAVSGSNTSYSSFQGTSMASPHVAGVVALLWSARPELRGQVALTRQILTQTARDTQELTQSCDGVAGTSIPNNTWGHGKIDALAAVQTTLDGNVTLNGDPIAATLSITDGTNTLEMMVDASGTYSTTLPTGVYTATASRFGLTSIEHQVTITSGQLTTQDFAFVSTRPYYLFSPFVFKSE